jgi:hypothetical protein
MGNTYHRVPYRAHPVRIRGRALRAHAPAHLYFYAPESLRWVKQSVSLKVSVLHIAMYGQQSTASVKQCVADLGKAQGRTCSTKETASRAAVSGVSVSGFEPINALLSTKMSVSSGDAEAKELEVLPEVLEEDPVVSLELPEESRLAAPRSNDDARFLWPFLCVELDSACNTADSTAKRTLGSKLCTSRIPHSQTNQSRNAPLSKGRFGEIFTSRKSPETTASCAPASSGAMKNKTSVFRAMFVTCMRKQSPVIEPNSRAGNRADRTGGVW